MRRDWQEGDKALYRGVEVEIVGKSQMKVRVRIPGKKGVRSVWPHGLTEVDSGELGSTQAGTYRGTQNEVERGEGKAR